jgi:hypothetical protein
MCVGQPLKDLHDREEGEEEGAAVGLWQAPIGNTHHVDNREEE